MGLAFGSLFSACYRRERPLRFRWISEWMGTYNESSREGMIQHPKHTHITLSWFRLPCIKLVHQHRACSLWLDLDLTSAIREPGECNQFTVRGLGITKGFDLDVQLLREARDPFRFHRLNFFLCCIIYWWQVFGVREWDGEIGKWCYACTHNAFALGTVYLVKSRSRSKNRNSHYSSKAFALYAGSANLSSVSWGTLESSSKQMPKKVCSWTFSPTPGESTLTSTPILERMSGRPTPESSRIWGDLMVLAKDGNVTVRSWGEGNQIEGLPSAKDHFFVNIYSVELVFSNEFNPRSSEVRSRGSIFKNDSWDEGTCQNL